MDLRIFVVIITVVVAKVWIFDVEFNGLMQEMKQEKKEALSRPLVVQPVSGR